MAVALLPLPGAASLPLAPDGLVLLGLLLAAAGLAGAQARPGGGVGLCAGAVGVLVAGAGSLGLPFAAVPLLVALWAAVAYAWGLASLGAPTKFRSPAILRLLLWLGWAGLGGLIPAPWNLLPVAGALVLLLAWAGRPALATLAHRTGWLGWLGLAVALIALLLG